jgi:hypothetical protein
MEATTMAERPHVSPKLTLAAFNCPHCGVYATQGWGGVYSYDPSSLLRITGWRVAVCQHCNAPSLWCGNDQYFPSGGAVPPPNSDLPDKIRSDYEEAREILGRSPRGAGALLRLAIQKLCKHLGQHGENLNDDIGELVKNGLPRGVQRALDIVRVIGNEAVHPGQIDLRDTPETAIALFGLVNLISEKMISEPKEIAAIYEALPKTKRDAIDKRDGK